MAVKNAAASELVCSMKSKTVPLQTDSATARIMSALESAPNVSMDSTAWKKRTTLAASLAPAMSVELKEELLLNAKPMMVSVLAKIT